MNPGELKILIDRQPALTLRVESTRAREVELEEHWKAVSVAWDEPPDRLRLNLWLDACLPENGSRESYGAYAAIKLLEHKLGAG